MAVDVVQEAFVRFERDRARVPVDQVRVGREVRDDICGYLAKSMPGLSRTQTVGSFGRKTQAQRLKDIDVLLLVDDPDGWWEASADRALEHVAQLARQHPLLRTATKKVRAVQLELHGHEFHVDLVLAVEPSVGPGLLLPRRIPEEGLDDWTLENPVGQVEAAVAKNAVCLGMYVPTARVIKFWNQGFQPEKALHSYHAESILWHGMSAGSTYAEAVVEFFEAADGALAPGVHVTDPGNPQHFVDDRLEEGERARGRALVREALGRARVALALQGEAALEAWVEVFGPSFPAPSTDPGRLQEVLVAGGAVAVGAGIREGSGRSVIQPRSWRI